MCCTRCLASLINHGALNPQQVNSEGTEHNGIGFVFKGRPKTSLVRTSLDLPWQATSAASLRVQRGHPAKGHLSRYPDDPLPMRPVSADTADTIVILKPTEHIKQNHYKYEGL